MGTRTVRLDDEAEKALGEIRRLTDLSISDALKDGLLALRERVRQERATTAWDVYERIDLGPGGYSIAPAAETKARVTARIRRKHRR